MSEEQRRHIDIWMPRDSKAPSLAKRFSPTHSMWFKFLPLWHVLETRSMNVKGLLCLKVEDSYLLPLTPIYKEIRRGRGQIVPVILATQRISDTKKVSPLLWNLNGVFSAQCSLPSFHYHVHLVKNPRKASEDLELTPAFGIYHSISLSLNFSLYKVEIECLPTEVWHALPKGKAPCNGRVTMIFHT